MSDAAAARSINESIEFVRARDGSEAATSFAQRAYIAYRGRLIGRKRMRNPQFRKPWLNAAITLRKHLRDAAITEREQT